MRDRVPYKWQAFSVDELETLKRVLDDHCDRYEDTCEEEEVLADEIYDELEARNDQR